MKKMIMQENLHSRGEQTPSEGGGHGTDNEAAPLWATIQRFPTFSRMRKGIMLAGDDGHVRQVDVRRLGRQERKNLVDRLVRTADDEDNSRLLLRIRERMER